MLKDIVVHVDDNQLARAPARVAAGLAARHGAQLLGVHCINVPSVPSFVDVEIPDSVRQAQREMFESAAEAAHQAFIAACSEAGTTGDWQCESGSPAHLLARHAMVADLMVVRRTRADSAGQMPASLAGDLVLGSRRPALVVPPEWEGNDLAGPITIAWNGTPESARALADALPVLAGAAETHVVWIDPGDAAQAQAELVRVCAHLSRHGVHGHPQIVEGPSDVGPALLEHAHRTGSSCVVIGAYGHSRMRELLFGGVTEFMLSRCELPVLMSH